MSLRISRTQGTTGLAVEGELLGAEAKSLEAAVVALLAEPGLPPGPIVLDCARLGGMDSAAFTVWVSAERKALAAGRKLMVRGAGKLVRQLFLLADLEDVLVP